MTVRCITPSDVAELARDAATRDRGRANLNLHEQLLDPIQRLFNALQPGTYVRPHRHVDPPRWEVFVAVSGRAVVLTFDETGRVDRRVELGPDAEAAAVEIDGGTWHTVGALHPDTVLFELKPGPYRPLEDKDFARWAPQEHDPGARRLVEWFAVAEPGASPPP
jgi:cupin fold WbuC family metalloprotein